MPSLARVLFGNVLFNLRVFGGYSSYLFFYNDTFVPFFFFKLLLLWCFIRYFSGHTVVACGI